MSREFLITEDFGSVRRCATETEMREVARILISAHPDCVAMDAAAPDLINYPGKTGLLVKGSRFDALIEAGIDPYGFMVARLKEAGIRVLANIRMNDHHGKPAYWTPWEQEHVDWSLGEDTGAHDWKAIGRLRHMDYAIEGVREYRLAIIEEILTRFDVDGVQLDFGRTAPFVSEPKREKGRFLTDYLRSVRALLKRTGRDDRPRTLGVALPWDFELCLAEGLEVPAWVEEELVDYLSPGEWYYSDWNLPLQPWVDAVKGSACRLHPFTPGNVSPYQDFEFGEPSRLGDNRVLDGPKLRAIADNFAAQGCDGFALYNFYTFDFGPYYPHLRRWVDPGQSAGQSRHYFNGRRLVYHATEKQTFDDGIAFERIPLSFAGDEAILPFRFASEIGAEAPVLRCAFVNGVNGDEVEVRLNGAVLAAARWEPDEAGPEPDSPIAVIWAGEVDASLLKRGENLLKLRLVKASDQRAGPIKVGEFEILVPGTM